MTALRLARGWQWQNIQFMLGELAYGTTRVTPDGTTRLEIVDLLEELDRQLSR
jgi:hypothetical protein